MYAIGTLGESPIASIECPSELHQILADFCDTIPDELPDELPPVKYIQYAIDFVPLSNLPNLLHYR